MLPSELLTPFVSIICSGFCGRGWSQLHRHAENEDQASSSTMDPNTDNVCGAPIRFATPPAISAPIGCTPMNIVAYTAITRLRSSSGTRFWISVLVAAICEVVANPTTNSTTAHSQKTFAPEKISKPMAHVVEVAPIHRASPL